MWKISKSFSLPTPLHFFLCFLLLFLFFLIQLDSLPEGAVCEQCETQICVGGVDVCLDCVAEGSGCGQHLGDLLLVQHFSEQYCKGICENGMEAYRYHPSSIYLSPPPPLFPPGCSIFHLLLKRLFRYMLACLGCTKDMTENEVANCRMSFNNVSTATIAFNQVVFQKEVFPFVSLIFFSSSSFFHILLRLECFFFSSLF